MSEDDRNQFSAADSALGYLYQVRVALVWALRRLKSATEFLVSIETLDDVTFETQGGAPDELLQTKHHRTRKASLSDASPDLWKSLRIWFEGHAAKSIPSDAALHLLTTAVAAAGTAPAYLRLQGRNVDAALTALESTAQSSTNAAFEAAFLVLAMVLHRETRESLPRGVATSLAVWLEEKPLAHSRIADLSRTLVPFTKEALNFGGLHGLLLVSPSIIRPNLNWRKKVTALLRASTQEVRECAKRAEFVGRWFAKTGSGATVMALIGVRP